MSAGASAGAQEAYERIHQEYETNRQAHTELVHKVEKMTGDLNEHEMVIRALEAVPKGRRCFNLVGGVLVERTVDEVIPSLKNNVQGINQIVAALTQRIQAKDKVMKELQAKLRAAADEARAAGAAMRAKAASA